MKTEEEIKKALDELTSDPKVKQRFDKAFHDVVLFGETKELPEDDTDYSHATDEDQERRHDQWMEQQELNASDPNLDY